MAIAADMTVQEEQLLQAVQQDPPDKAKGGFQIPLGFLSQHADRELLYRMTYELVQDKFLEAIGRKG